MALSWFGFRWATFYHWTDGFGGTPSLLADLNSFPLVQETFGEVTSCGIIWRATQKGFFHDRPKWLVILGDHAVLELEGTLGSGDIEVIDTTLLTRRIQVAHMCLYGEGHDYELFDIERP